MSSRRLTTAIFATASACSASAAATAADNGAQWNLTAGTEYGQDGSRGSLASINYGSNGADVDASAGISGLHSDAPAASGSTVSSSGEAHFLYGSDRMRGGGAFAVTTDQNFRHSQQWTGTLGFGAGAWKADLNGSTRRTQFESVPVPTSTPPALSSATADPLAACSIKDFGYGLTLGYGQNGWSAYASAAANRFDPVDCSSAVKVPNALQRFSSSDFRNFGGSFLDRARVRAGGSIGQSTALLQSQYTAGIARSWGRTSLAFDYSHAKAEFGSSTQDSAPAFEP